MTSKKPVKTAIKIIKRQFSQSKRYPINSASETEFGVVSAANVS